MRTECFWTEEFPRPADPAVVTELPGQVDVAIVGSGYTGLNAARVLAYAGHSVAVFDSQIIGWGGSSRNGGMATPGLKQDIMAIHKKYGEEYAREFWKASVDAIDLLENVIVEEDINCDWYRSGHVSLAYKQSHFDGLVKYGEWIEKQFGHPKKVIQKSELKSEIGTDAYFGGLSDETSGGIQPAKYVFGLAKAVADKGVRLYENTRVKQVSKHSSGFRLETSKGVLSASEVIIATNGYTDRMIKELKPKVFPVGSYIIVTEPLSEDMQKRLSPKRRMYYDSKNFLNYFRLTPNGRMLWGGRNNLSTTLDLNESADQLKKQLYRVFPELTSIPITHTWSGKLGITFDLMPHIGRTKNGIHYVFGYGGHGLSIATYLGTEIGMMLTGEKDRSPFAEITHQTMFFYRNRPWFIPFANKYYQFLDWVS